MFDLLQQVQALVESFIEVVQVFLEAKKFGLLDKFRSNIISKGIKEQFSENSEFFVPFVPKHLTKLVKLVALHRQNSSLNDPGRIFFARKGS